MSSRRVSFAPSAAARLDTSIPRRAKRPILDGQPRRAVQLYPGQVFASKDPSVVSTILGSCVAVCIWDPQTRIGGINHYMLPDPVGSSQLSPRFGVVACARLLDDLLALGSDPRALRAKIFGGACVLSSFASSSGTHLGVKNVAVAKAFLAQRQVPIEAEETGGAHGRKLVFVTDSGTAWVQAIQRATHGP